jgi:hypothetical protein
MILLKSDWNNITCYKKFKGEELAKSWYYNDISAIITVLSSKKNEEVFNLILKAVKERPEIGVLTETAKEFT